ncbi:MAG: PIG-L family deacetylase [Spartobacteria bacterium]|nr:PIG-L family deacetylase [Spartobacteria bacterium]
MRLKNADAEIYVPDGRPLEEALDRVTHLGIGAHPGDLEMMAYHGILSSFQTSKNWFGGVICADGRGCPRAGAYEDYTDDMMRITRAQEQRAAAVIGQYGFMAQLSYTSEEVKDAPNALLCEDLKQVLRATHPSVLYTHSPSDKHETHIATLTAVIRAVRDLPKRERPQTIYGCEQWRDLDWMLDTDKIALDVGGHENLAAALLGVFDSQIAGGKSYDVAALGRRRANATYFEAYSVDTSDELLFAIDLSPLAHNDDLSLTEYTATLMSHFTNDVITRLKRHTGE